MSAIRQGFLHTGPAGFGQLQALPNWQQCAQSRRCGSCLIVSKAVVRLSQGRRCEGVKGNNCIGFQDAGYLVQALCYEYAWIYFIFQIHNGKQIISTRNGIDLTLGNIVRHECGNVIRLSKFAFYLHDQRLHVHSLALAAHDKEPLRSWMSKREYPKAEPA
jgi:hypothetical protein